LSEKKVQYFDKSLLSNINKRIIQNEYKDVFERDDKIIDDGEGEITGESSIIVHRSIFNNWNKLSSREHFSVEGV